MRPYPLPQAAGRTPAGDWRWTPWPGVICRYARIAALEPLPPCADEQAWLAQRSPRRRQQSLAARTLARRTLEELGLPPAALPPTEQGQARFPPGSVGSLSHCDTAVAAVVAAHAHCAALGVDVEPAQPLPEDAAQLVASASERAALTRLPGGWPVWGRALLGAKECVHKCVNPLSGAWLEFDEVEVLLDPHSSFTVRPLSVAARQALNGKVQGFVQRLDEHLLCVLALSPRRCAKS